MTLTTGTRLGPYEIQSPLGAGGMGEVYKARDTRLERTVAVKVLPDHLSSSADVRQRFEREAKTISQLSHPHICALYDVGREGETEYLVMEYLEGETLTDRLSGGALPLEQTLKFGIEISDALDKAHRQGIVHRDLKPGNVMLTKSGVKLLDFGLAKAMAPAVPASSLTALPTVARAANLTQEGTILGTFQYMAPEQLEGKEADGRTDIFALGAVLYEMATGRKAFSGTSQASLISSIMKEDPAPISTIQPMTPPALDRVVKTCLAKDPEDRWQSAHDVSGELKWISEGSQAGVPARVAAQRKGRERMAWALAGIATVLAVLLAVGYVRRAPKPASLLRASLVLPEKMFLTDLALSPDGKRVAFTLGKVGISPSLWVRDLDKDAAQAVAGADEVSFPFWSPDSTAVAFFAEGKLRRVDLRTETITTVCDADTGVGGSWNKAGTIVFAPLGTSPLFRVPASGGKPVPVTKLDSSRHEAAHRYPHFLPDGNHFLYTAAALGSAGPGAQGSIRIGSLDGSVDKVLVEAISNAQYAAGRVLYVREQALVAQQLNAGRLEVEGEPTVIASRAVQLSDWSGSFAFSVLADRLTMARPLELPGRLSWLDRTGKVLGALGEPSLFGRLRLSPDGRRVAAAIWNPSKLTSEIWIFESPSGAASRFIFGPYLHEFPVWSADGQRLFFSSDRRARAVKGDIWSKPIDGSAEEPFLLSSDDIYPLDSSRDGRYLVIRKTPAQGKRNNEIWVLDREAQNKQAPFSTEAPEADEARFSPDGKWIAYCNDVTGTWEVYVRPFLGPGGERKVSMGGGTVPRWRGDGKELYYFGLDDRIMAVSIDSGQTFHAGAPVPLFTAHISGRANFDVDAEGKRFLVPLSPEVTGTAPLDLLVNWTALLQKGEPAR